MNLHPELSLSRFSAGFYGLLRKAEVDRPVAYIVLTRAWSFISGPVSALLIAFYFSLELQGYYYTFSSLLALQSFVELNFYGVLLFFASHEWAHLELDSRGSIRGSPRAASRLAGLGQLALRWYAAASAVFVVGVGAAGYLFFSRHPSPNLEWVAPWLALVSVASLNLWMLPLQAILEGCNQLKNLYLWKLIQGILFSLTLWSAIVLGGKLWAPWAAQTAAWICNLGLVFVSYKYFFKQILFSPVEDRISWRSEIWPMQWRLGSAGVVNYLAFSLFTPVMFHYHGPAVAGRMGMTWALVSALAMTGWSWVQARSPRFGMLIAQKDYVALDVLFFRIAGVSTAMVSAGALLIGAGVYFLNVLGHPLALRLLPPFPTALFLLATVLMHISLCQSAYLRAHKQEPLLVLSLVASPTIAFLVWQWGMRYGPIGAAWGYLTVVALFVLPYGTFLWRRYRTLWHSSGDLS